jgi:hypothetical protein
MAPLATKLGAFFNTVRQVAPAFLAVERSAHAVSASVPTRPAGGDRRRGDLGVRDPNLAEDRDTLYRRPVAHL